MWLCVVFGLGMGGVWQFMVVGMGVWSQGFDYLDCPLQIHESSAIRRELGAPEMLSGKLS